MCHAALPFFCWLALNVTFVISTAVFPNETFVSQRESTLNLYEKHCQSIFSRKMKKVYIHSHALSAGSQLPAQYVLCHVSLPSGLRIVFRFRYLQLLSSSSQLA